MATLKEYAYYLKGRKIAIVERDFTSIQNGQTLTAPSVDLPSGGGTWKSPLEAVTDGLEIEYTYTPMYSLGEESVAVGNWTDGNNNSTADNGYLMINHISGSIFSDSTNWPVSPAGTYIVIKGSERWNGLHRIRKVVTDNKLILDTKIHGAEGSVARESSLSGGALVVHYNVEVVIDESSHLDVSEYYAKAVVCYVKAKLLEDAGKFNESEYFMRKFQKMVEKEEDSRIWGMRQIMSGPNAIR